MSTRSQRRYLQLDVFADRPGAGNPLGVVFAADDMTATSMQAFAAWTNLSETIFLLQPTTADADYRVRIFTPRQELPFAGHPSVGAAWAVLDDGVNARNEMLVQECAAGLLPVRVTEDDRSIHVRAPSAKPQRNLPEAVAPLLRAALHGMPLGTQPPALWNNGPGFWLVELRDASAVRALMPELAAIAALTNASGAVGFAVYGRTTSDTPDHVDLVVRVFCPADNIPEDPVTGSANACIAALLASARSLPGEGGRYRASQGREVGRDGIVDVEVTASGEVWIGGRVQRVIDGSVAWPDDIAVSA